MFIRSWILLLLPNWSSGRRTLLSFIRSGGQKHQSNLFDSSSSSKNLWSLEECMKHRDKIKFLDGSWYHKGNRNGRLEFENGPRIPGAHFWDMDDIATSKELFPELNPMGLRVMFPSKSLISTTLQSMNISTPHDQIIIYGRRGCFFTPRVWYILKTFGHSKVGLLQGSLEDWVEAGGPVDTRPISYGLWGKHIMQTDEYQRTSAVFRTNDKLDRLLDRKDVLEHLSIGRNDSVRLFDTRGHETFAKGHIPGATSIPYKSLVQPDNALKFKPREDLQRILKSHNVDEARKIWLSCGSGVSVCHLALALEECGYSQKPYIYDGSWNEWGSDPLSPKEVSIS